MKRSWVEFLGAVSRADIALVGGKAASLGEMIGARLPVPNGFVVTTEAYKAFARPLARNETPSDSNGIMFYNQVLRAFDKLGVSRVAVRSSAVAEDSADASWAGQLESYLNVTRDGLIEAVKLCWGSIESTRAKHYADEHNVEQSDRAMAVVVQQMVDSEISGVMFTANPVTGNRDEMMIEVVYGLGEMIVQGLATPESIALNKASGAIISRSQHRQAKKLVFQNGKNTEVPLESELRNKDIVSDSQIKELVGLAKKIEHHYASPQDIEWAFADGKFYIVQSRPVTTLTTQLSQNTETMPFDANSELFRWGPVRGYYFLISDYVAACYHSLHQSYEKEYFPEVLLLFKEKQMVWLAKNNHWVADGKRVFEEYIENALTLTKMKQNWDKAVADLVDLEITIIPNNLQKLSDKEFIALWHDFYQVMMAFWVPTLLPELGNYGAPDLLKQDLEKYIKDDEELIRAQEVLTAPEELSFYQQEEFQLVETTDLSAHQAKYFWLKNSYGYVGVLDEAFFKERQTELAKSIKAPSQHELRQSAQAAKVELQKQYNLSETVVRRAKLIADNIVWQDHRKRIMAENFHYKKLLIEELARRIKKSPLDLLHFGFDEAIGLLKNSKYKKRQSYYGVQFREQLTQLTSKQAETYWQEYAYHKTQNIDVIRGVVASKSKDSGVVRGKVRVLHSSHDQLEPGEILVTAMTSPSYVFAMRQAAGVITDIGGLTSHAAIVAREIGVPCIVGTKVATQVLKTGDEVEIDANKGIIRLIKER